VGGILERAGDAGRQGARREPRAARVELEERELRLLDVGREGAVHPHPGVVG